MPLKKTNSQPKISVAEFVKQAPAELRVEILVETAKGQKKCISSEMIQKLGLSLAAGFAHFLHAGRIQIVGQNEISYLAQLESKKRIEAINNLDLAKICCILITKNLNPPPELLEIAREKNLTVLRTALISSKAINLITNFLVEALAPQTMIHGVLVGMYGIGVLLIGDSGIGKSECALDLISGGHQLVSDDAVVIKKIGDALIGSSPELTYEHLEVRGLGIINIRNLFGVWAVVPPKKIVLCIEFKKWRDVPDVERLGLEAREEEILGVKIAKFILPVSAGRNLSTLVETAVRVYLLKISGIDAAHDLIEKHTAMLSRA